MLCIFVVFAFVARIVARLIEAIVAPGVRWAWRMITPGAGRLANGDQSPSARDQTEADSESTITGFTLWSTIAIPSALYVVTVDVYFFHYFFVFCPFLSVLVAVCMLPWRRVLLGMVVAQALLSYSFLSFVHAKGGTDRGDYGRTYARQGNR
jgi:hypothetical protein